jgi:hypothetical protein
MLQVANQLLSFGFEPPYQGEITFGVSISHGLSSSARRKADDARIRRRRVLPSRFVGDLVNKRHADLMNRARGFAGGWGHVS